MSVLSVDGVSKTYQGGREDEVPVLDTVHFAVSAGEIVAVVGVSGTGKTTLLRIVAGVDEATTGSTSVNGEANLLARISYMQQGDSLLPWRTALANVRFGLEIIGSSNGASAERSIALLGKVGLWEERSKYPAQLSGGMRRRVALARTLAVPADLYLFDEPLVHLDFLSRRPLAALIRGEITDHKAAVLVTHSIEEAVSMGDRIMILNGRPATFVDEFSIDRNRLAVDEFGGLPAEAEAMLYARIAKAFRSKSSLSGGVQC